MPVPDPTPFLSTTAGVSATFVAIIGGLLVARFVALDSEQQGAQQSLDNAEGRLDRAGNRTDGARLRLRQWDLEDFLNKEVIESIGQCNTDISELRRIRPSSLSDDDLTQGVQATADEFARARTTLREMHVGDADAPEDSWQVFKRTWTDAPKLLSDEVWEMVYDELVPPTSSAPGFQTWTGSSLGSPAQDIDWRMLPDIFVHRLQERNSLSAALDRAEQHQEDLEAEVEELRQARNAIVRPKGLGTGLAVLIVFTIVGVLIPLFLMSRGPKRLTAHLGEVVFWLFFVGLAALLSYMTRLALRLSKRRKGISGTEVPPPPEEKSDSPAKTPN